MRTFRRPVAVIVPVVSLLLLSACSDDGGADGDSTPSSSASEDSDAGMPSPMMESDMASEEPAATGEAGILAMLAGTWTGTWDNTTFGSSGSIDLVLAVDDAGVATITLDFGGNVFGGSDPDAETIELPEGALSGTAIMTELFGPVVLSANGLGTAFSAVAGAVPAEGIDSAEFEGALGEGGTITGTYTITFTDANTAEGTFTISAA